MPKAIDLKNKTAVITGASRGIGLEIAQAFIEAGAKVIITGRNQNSINTALSKLGEMAYGYSADISKEDEVKNLVKYTESNFNQIDVLVNNAGINPYYKYTENTELSEWSNIIDVNLTGVFLCIREFGKKMLEQKSGSIINITSVAAHTGLSRSGAYCAAKAGVEALTKSLAKDWASQGVRVNNVAPGYVKTDLTAGLADNEKLRSMVENRTPMGRFADTTEMAGAVIFLGSDAASYVTGSTLAVDGGWIAT